MGQLTYKIQSLDARLKRLEKENRGIESLPAFHFNSNPGACQELFYREDAELLIYGGAGTGKTTACMAKIHKLCMEYPNIRVLVVRKTKADLAETVLKAFEVFVLGKGHPLLQGASRYNRRSYIYPNGSRIVLGGMDTGSRVMGADYDIVYVSEATELTLEDYEFLSTRLRNNRLPFQQLLTDCNPGSPSHFLYKRFQQGELKPLKSIHEDNPKFFNWKFQEWTKEGTEYLNRFKNISGVRYERLRKGEWTVAEGAIYPEFEENRHILRGPVPTFRSYISGIDWGWSAHGAGVLLTFGITKDDALILVDEVYQTGRTLDWWIAEAMTVKMKYNPEKFVCDPSAPANIQAMKYKGLNVMAGNNKWEFGVDLIRRRLRDMTLKFHYNSVKHPDLSLKENMRPWRLTEEITGYVLEKDRERPEPGLSDHALDAMRYVVAYHDRLKNPTLPATSTSLAQFEN